MAKSRTNPSGYLGHSDLGCGIPANILGLVEKWGGNKNFLIRYVEAEIYNSRPSLACARSTRRIEGEEALRWGSSRWQGVLVFMNDGHSFSFSCYGWPYVWGTSPRNCFLGSLPVFLNSSWCELILPNSELYSSGCFFSNWIFKVKSFRSLFESFTPPAPNFIFVQKLSSLLVALTYSSDRQSCLGRRFTLMTKFPKCPARGLLPFLTYCTSISSSRRSQGGKWARRIG